VIDSTVNTIELRLTMLGGAIKAALTSADN